MSISDLNAQSDVTIGKITTNALQFINSGTPFTQYGETGLSGSFTGPFGIHGPVASTGVIRNIGFVTTFSIIGILAQTDNNAIITYSNLLNPKPYATVDIPIWVIDQGNTVAGNCRIDTNGTVTIYKGYNGVFTGASTAGFRTFTASYCTYN